MIRFFKMVFYFIAGFSTLIFWSIGFFFADLFYRIINFFIGEGENE